MGTLGRSDKTPEINFSSIFLAIPMKLGLMDGDVGDDVGIV